MHCTHIKSNGKKCGAICLKGETKCLFHSQSEKGKLGRKKQHERTPMSLEQHILLLERQLRRVQKSKDEEFRSGETRRIITLIYELKGEKPPSGDDKKPLSFHEKVQKAKSREKNDE